MDLLVRYGPAPDTTVDGDGAVHADLPDFFLLPTPPEEVAAMVRGGPDDRLIELAAAVWLALTAEGHGHMLIGAHTGFEYVSAAAAAPSCGFTLGVSAKGTPFAPKGYALLYAVARAARPEGQPVDGAPHVDLGIDYRGTDGPGDERIRPVIFAPKPLPEVGGGSGGGPGGGSSGG